MPPFRQLLRLLLILHGLVNIAQGIYAILYPSAWAAAVGKPFVGVNEEVLQSIALGSLGVGIYGAAGAISNDRRFYAVTAAMRVVFGCFVLVQWGLEGHRGVVGYEFAVAGLAGLASLA